MLAAAQRLRRSNDFAAAIRGGRRAGRGTVVVHLDLSPRSDQASRSDQPSIEPAPARSSELPVRAGFVVSKAVGPAVVRNTVRRRLRHLLRDRLTLLPAGSTVVVRALPAAAAAPYAQLGTDLDAALAAARSPRHRGGRGTRSGTP